MLKRQIMKKVFDNKFNIDDMRNQILLKNERKNDKMSKFYKYAIPVFLVSICSVIFFSQKDLIFKTNNNENIHVNKLDNLLQSEKVLEVEEVDIENIPEKFNFINNINLPKSFTLDRRYNLYTRSNIEVSVFDILRDYVFQYRDINGNKIVISFSEIGTPLKDYIVKNEVTSKINNIDVYISQYEDLYIVTFMYRDLYFSIEAENVNVEELTLLLESIIK